MGSTTDAIPKASTSAPPMTDTGMDADAPMITNFFADRQTLEPGASISFTATVSHPGGLSEIVGGTLEHNGTGSTYAAFEQTAGGTFTVSTSWEALHATTPISGPRDGAWTVEAVFFDNAGASASATLDLMLQCEGIDVCGGGCVDWTLDGTNCGGCGTVCGAGSACNASECAPVGLSPCFRPDEMTCAEACGELGQVCVENGCNGATYAWFANLDGCLAQSDPELAPGACGLPYMEPADEDTGLPPSGFITAPDEAVRCCCS